ncbi:hypothetical protein Q3G72_032348 [Acer saccharum]|nr:hypothetical protein Q3G72_032348 [Acer saccharum]
MLEKGKVRENLTKKIYGNSSGKQRHAWVKDCEVEFWKYRCMRATKPEKIETLKLYLADTSVFPRKKDNKPLSALKPTSDSERSKEQTISVVKDLKLSLDNFSPKVLETSKVSSKVGIPSANEKGTGNNVTCSKGDAASSKVHLKGCPTGPSVSQKGTMVKSDDVKTDKRKWALEILARKNAFAGKNTTPGKQEGNDALKGNYSRLAKLPVDMRPVLAPSCHNKIPISVRQILHRSDNKKSIRDKESNSSPSVDESGQATDNISSDPEVEEALRKAGLLSDSPPNSPHHPTEVPNEVDVSSREEGPDDNVFEVDSHADVDIYGDFEYDLEDEDYIGASSVTVPTLQSEEVSKMKVVFSTLNSEKSINTEDTGIKSSTAEGQTGNSCVPPESNPCEEDEDLSLAECEELYGPDKEPLLNKFPELSGNPHGLLDGEAALNMVTESNGDNITVNHNSSSIEKSPNSSQTGDRIPRKAGADKQSDGVDSISKKVEAYIKEHIRPLCKSGVITTEQHRWTIVKTTDKVMKYHSKAKNANFLIKEGEKVKKLAEQYIEAAQQEEKSDLQQ